MKTSLVSKRKTLQPTYGAKEKVETQELNCGMWKRELQPCFGTKCALPIGIGDPYGRSLPSAKRIAYVVPLYPHCVRPATSFSFYSLNWHLVFLFVEIVPGLAQTVRVR